MLFRGRQAVSQIETQIHRIALRLLDNTIIIEIQLSLIISMNIFLKLCLKYNFFEIWNCQI